MRGRSISRGRDGPRNNGGGRRQPALSSLKGESLPVSPVVRRSTVQMRMMSSSAQVLLLSSSSSDELKNFRSPTFAHKSIPQQQGTGLEGVSEYSGERQNCHTQHHRDSHSYDGRVHSYSAGWGDERHRRGRSHSSQKQKQSLSSGPLAVRSSSRTRGTAQRRVIDELISGAFEVEVRHRRGRSHSSRQQLMSSSGETSRGNTRPLAAHSHHNRSSSRKRGTAPRRDIDEPISGASEAAYAVRAPRSSSRPRREVTNNGHPCSSFRLRRVVNGRYIPKSRPEEHSPPPSLQSTLDTSPPSSREGITLWKRTTSNNSKDMEASLSKSKKSTSFRDTSSRSIKKSSHNNGNPRRKAMSSSDCGLKGVANPCHQQDQRHHQINLEIDGKGKGQFHIATKEWNKHSSTSASSPKSSMSSHLTFHVQMDESSQRYVIHSSLGRLDKIRNRHPGMNILRTLSHWNELLKKSRILSDDVVKDGTNATAVCVRVGQLGITSEQIKNSRGRMIKTDMIKMTLIGEYSHRKWEIDALFQKELERFVEEALQFHLCLNGFSGGEDSDQFCQVVGDGVGGIEDDGNKSKSTSNLLGGYMISRDTRTRLLTRMVMSMPTKTSVVIATVPKLSSKIIS